MQDEERERGTVKFREYSVYVKAGGGWCVFAFLTLLLVAEVLSNYFNIRWVDLWTTSAGRGYEDYDMLGVDFDVSGNLTAQQEDQQQTAGLLFYAVGYAGTALLIALLTLFRSVAFALFGVRASVSLHRRLMSSVIRAPMSFFNTTPIGRIISRFTKDLFEIDIQTILNLQFTLHSMLMLLQILVVIAITTPHFLIAVPLILVLYSYILQIYRPVARDIKRLEALSRSPVYAHFSETLGGLTTIRAYRVMDTFERESERKVDDNILYQYAMIASDHWQFIRMSFMGSTTVFLAAFLAMYTSWQGQLSAGAAGVSLTMSINLTSILARTLYFMADLETGMNCVSRVLHYSYNIEQEAPPTSKHPPSPEWPSRGRISIQHLSMRYRRTTPLVLKDVSVEIGAGERVGVVGRTGSGKSSLMLCLLRLVEPEFTGARGPIAIDGVDICRIGLDELRSRIGIVPQSPTIFSGTIRSNLDPFDRYEDEAVWSALEKVGLKGLAGESSEKLQYPVSEYGDNLSQGQRQLLCLSRALLSKSRVLMLDEATSSVDFDTDVRIQRMIRSQTSFAGCTVLTIAHRINTVIDSDEILVLRNGEVAQYGPPSELLRSPESAFAKMVRESKRS